jgi:glycine cleavage system H protein
MATFRKCTLPDDLLYHVENNVWLRDKGDGSYELGMTDIAQSMAGSVIHCRIKKAGKSVKAGKSLATVESGKWVGPVKAPFACEVVTKNDAVEKDASVLNRSPYKDGWIVCIKPADAAAAAAALVRGDEAIAGFEAYMDAAEFTECTHCEGCDLA